LIDVIEDHFQAGNFDLFQIIGEEQATNFADKSKEARSKLLSASGIDDLISQPLDFHFLEQLTVALLSDIKVTQVNKFGAIAERDGAIAERDGAIAERDGAIAERDGLFNSRIWRFSRPYRKLRTKLRF